MVAYNLLTFPGRIIMVLFVFPMPVIVPGLIFLGKDAIGIFTRGVACRVWV